MSFEFLGTFNRSQFERFAAFARSQKRYIDGRIDHLRAELRRVGGIAFKYNDDGTPVGYAADPPDSYIGKLLSAYEVLGGQVFFDLQVRNLSDPIFLLRGDETKSPQIMSNGEVLRTPGLADGPSAELMREARAWMEDVIQYRRDYLERKIRRMLDYSDQLKREIVVLQVIRADETTKGSLENLFNQIQELIENKQYMAIYDDHGTDPHGQKVYAPYAAYEPGKGRGPSEQYQRTTRGVVAPGES